MYIFSIDVLYESAALLYLVYFYFRVGSDWWKRIQAAPTLLWLAEPWHDVRNT